MAYHRSLLHLIYKLKVFKPKFMLFPSFILAQWVLYGDQDGWFNC